MHVFVAFNTKGKTTGKEYQTRKEGDLWLPSTCSPDVSLWVYNMITKYIFTYINVSLVSFLATTTIHLATTTIH